MKLLGIEAPLLLGCFYLDASRWTRGTNRQLRSGMAG